MLADTTIRVRIYGETRKDPVANYMDASSGTDFKYIRSDGENIMVRESQLWFWTPEWQKRHEDAVADLNEERSTVYETGEDFLTAIKEAIAHNEVHNS